MLYDDTACYTSYAANKLFELSKNIIEALDLLILWKEIVYFLINQAIGTANLIMFFRS